MRVLFCVCSLAPCLILLTSSPVGSAGGANTAPAQDAYTPTLIDPYLVIDEWTPNGSTSESDYLYKPGSVTLDEQGNIYVLDSQNYRVVVFSPTGEHLYNFGQRGQGPGEFRFSRDSRDDIALVGETIIIVEKTWGRVQIFDKTGEYISSFSGPLGVTSLSANGSSIYVSVFPRTAGEPTILEYDYDGLQRRSLGSAPFSGSLRGNNASLVAVDDLGLVRQVFRSFRLVRTFENTGEVVDQWYDFTWWENRQLADWYLLSRNSQEDFESLRVGGSEADRQWQNFGEIPADLRMRIIFQDIEYAEDAEVWVALMYGGVVQAFSDDGTPLEAYLLTTPGQEDRTSAADLGVTPDGKVACLADSYDSVVRCYPVTDGWR